jgi:hypothetical protein
MSKTQNNGDKCSSKEGEKVGYFYGFVKRISLQWEIFSERGGGGSVTNVNEN